MCFRAGRVQRRPEYVGAKIGGEIGVKHQLLVSHGRSSLLSFPYSKSGYVTWCLDFVLLKTLDFVPRKTQLLEQTLKRICCWIPLALDKSSCVNRQFNKVVRVCLVFPKMSLTHLIQSHESKPLVMSGDSCDTVSQKKLSTKTFFCLLCFVARWYCWWGIELELPFGWSSRGLAFFQLQVLSFKPWCSPVL